jgi:hypothetical protein
MTRKAPLVFRGLLPKDFLLKRQTTYKRTASLVMNGVLMSGGYYPINIDTPPLDFLRGMADFYETADGTKMMSMLNDLGKG